MEFPHLGRNCAFRTCNRLDFLPYKCGACLESFCSDHFAFVNHECPASNNRDVQVPECPLCGAPVPGRRGEAPDVAVGEHIDNQCQSDPAKERRQKVYTNRCAYKGCKTKEMMPLVCNECELNYCLKHRHSADHACEGALAAKRRKAAPVKERAKADLNQNRENVAEPDPNETPEEFMRRRAAEAAMARLASGQTRKLEFRTRIESNPGRARVATLRDARAVQGNMTEDEALATALSMSLAGTSLGGGDVAIARSLARRVGATITKGSSHRPRPRYSDNSRASGSQRNALNFFEIFKIVGGIIFALFIFSRLKYMFKGSRSIYDSSHNDIDMY